jgi:purine-nucleoside phosphorylase
MNGRPDVSSGEWRLREDYVARVEAAADPLRQDGFAAQVGVVLGSGLGSVAEQLDVERERPFDQIAGFKSATVAAHRGKLVHARLPRGGMRVLLLQGRLHAYEGLPMEDVVLPVATLLALGVRTLVVTNAAGGLHPDVRAGDLMAITGLLEQHLQDPLRGLLLPPAGVPTELSLRAAAHVHPFDPELARRLVEIGAREGVVVGSGVYASLWGPAYETLTEIAMFRRLGAAAVGMSTGPESALASRLGARVAGVSCITNVSREVPGTLLTHDEVIAIGQAARVRLTRLLIGFIRSLVGSGL